MDLSAEMRSGLTEVPYLKHEGYESPDADCLNHWKCDRRENTENKILNLAEMRLELSEDPRYTGILSFGNHIVHSFDEFLWRLELDDQLKVLFGKLRLAVL
jgi:hypothetical protein